MNAEVLEYLQLRYIKNVSIADSALLTQQIKRRHAQLLLCARHLLEPSLTDGVVYKTHICFQESHANCLQSPSA